MIDLPAWALLIACSGTDCQLPAVGRCFPRAVVAQHLRGNRWRELPVWAGLTPDGSVLELWVGADTWTIIETVPTTPERMSCHRSSGTGSSGAPVVGFPASVEP